MIIVQPLIAVISINVWEAALSSVTHPYIEREFCSTYLSNFQPPEAYFTKGDIYYNFEVIVVTKHVNVFSDKPAAAPAAKKAAVDGRLFFVSEPQSIRVVESKCTSWEVHLHLSCTFCLWFNFGRTDFRKLNFYSLVFIIP